METDLVFLHGFLGSASDWQHVLTHLPNKSRCHTVDLERDFSIEDYSFENWPQVFQRWLLAHRVSSNFVAIGYSLGGRLVLPLLEKGICHRALLIGAHPGLPEEARQERTQRNELNEKWARKFLDEPWDLVLKEWNQQDVFAGSKAEPLRVEKEHSRSKLAAIMTGFSLGRQKDYSSILRTQGLQAHYLVGESDHRYREVGTNLKSSQVSMTVINDSGHRVLFDQPFAVAREIIQFVKS